MYKILLIIQREYLTRVKKKSFIIMIFVVPGLILLMSVVIGIVSKNSDEISTPQVIKVLDQSGQFAGKFHNVKNITYSNTTETLNAMKQDLKKDENLWLLKINANFAKNDSVEIYSKKKPAFPLMGEIQKQMNDIAINNNLDSFHIDHAVRSYLKSDISLNAVEVTDAGDKNADVNANIGIGISCAVLIYLSIFIYSTQVMRGVVEEKTSRIIEVVISSVKPFQLMLGKIIGVGMVGLTQFAAWIILAFVSTKVADRTLSGSSGIMSMLSNLQHIHFGPILFIFLFYFLTGYLLYSALFAAAGSSVDSETETQQFMLPITMPLIFTYSISIFLCRAPDGPLAIWLSIIPFTSPIAMMVRFPLGGVSVWQLMLSMFLMIIGFLFTSYVASRIYRIGILMYGKKSSYKELVKWFFYKE